jgi:DNA-binding NarL/FixJ family response regulator
MDALAEALNQAESTDMIGEEVLAAARRHIGLSALSFLRVSGPVISPADLYVINQRQSRVHSRAGLGEILPLIDRELGSFSSFIASRRRSFNVAERFRPEVIRRSQVFNAFWRPLAVERQLVGFLGTVREPIGFVAVCRSDREPAFTAADLKVFEAMREIVDRALVTARHLGRGKLEDTLTVLSNATPAPWLLFDAAGDLLWLTEEARSMLSADAVRIGSSIALRHSEAIERLRAWIRAEARKRPASSSAPPACRAASPGAEFVMRRFETSPGRQLFLVGFADPGPRGTGAFGEAPEPETARRTARLARRYDLTARQTEVLSHLAHGKANKTIAALLGCAEVTIEFHVTALLAKLDCESRAEAVARFWTS